MHLHCPPIFSSMTPRPQRSTLFPYTTLFRSESLSAEPLPTESVSTESVSTEPLRRLAAPTAIRCLPAAARSPGRRYRCRSEEHTSELQSRGHLVCRLLLEKKKIQTDNRHHSH